MELHELIEKGGVDGPVYEDTAVRTLSIIYSAIEADDHLTDYKKEVLSEIVSGAYTKLLRSNRSLVLGVY